MSVPESPTSSSHTGRRQGCPFSSRITRGFQRPCSNKSSYVNILIPSGESHDGAVGYTRCITGGNHSRPFSRDVAHVAHEVLPVGGERWTSRLDLHPSNRLYRVAGGGPGQARQKARASWYNRIKAALQDVAVSICMGLCPYGNPADCTYPRMEPPILSKTSRSLATQLLVAMRSS